MAGEMLRIAGVAVIAVSAAMILKGSRPEMAMQISLAAGVLLLAWSMEAIFGIRGAVTDFLRRYGMDTESLGAVFRIMGIAYIAQFAADTCRDCGESAIASKVELSGRVMMIAVALPLITAAMSAIGGLLGQ